MTAELELQRSQIHTYYVKRKTGGLIFLLKKRTTKSFQTKRKNIFGNEVCNNYRPRNTN